MDCRETCSWRTSSTSTNRSPPGKSGSKSQACWRLCLFAFSSMNRCITLFFKWLFPASPSQRHRGTHGGEKEAGGPASVPLKVVMLEEVFCHPQPCITFSLDISIHCRLIVSLDPMLQKNSSTDMYIRQETSMPQIPQVPVVLP